jgi:23S rRNA (guanosine2251-2'-O)-methyltransferase
MKEVIYLYGKNPLNEALLAMSRGQKSLIEKLYLTKQGESDPHIMSLVQSHKLSYDIVTTDEIEHMAGRGVVHQGICALLREELLYTPLDTVLATSTDSTKNKLFILLDELQDPHNVGAIIRSAVAFGASAILLPEHDQTQINGTVIKTSSGMNFAIPIVRIGNVNTTLTKLKEKGF